MQAQSYPPENQSSAHSVAPSRSKKREISLPNQTSVRTTPTSEVRKMARSGDFRAIASILNGVLTPHHIEAWVGEAGPGYLQVTLTVKRPPNRQPLTRLISHQLYSLKSEVILGANLTVQVHQTNLILWHQLVRLPLPEIYRQPSTWDVWRERLQTWQKQADTSTQSAWVSSHQQVQVWYDQFCSRLTAKSSQPAQNEPPLAYQTTSPPDGASDGTLTHHGSLNNQPSDNQSSVGLNADVLARAAEASDLVQPKREGAIPPHILQQAQMFAQQQSQRQEVSPSLQTSGQGEISASVGSQTASLSQDSGENFAAAAAMAMVPGAVMFPPSAPSDSANVPAIQQADTQSAEPSSNRLDGLGTVRHKVVHQVMNPSPLLIGGAAIAAFVLGSMVVGSIGKDGEPDRSRSPLDSPSVVANVPGIEPSDIGHSDIEPSDNRTGDRDAAQLEASSASIPETDAEASVQESRIRATTSRVNRPKTVEMGDQTITVASVVPTTSATSEVTLTFSGDAIVPLPPPEPPKATGWRSLLPNSTPTYIRHPADLAMALFNTPLQASGSTARGSSTLTTQSLRQGGIDVVNIAGNDISKSQSPSLSETLRVLEQSTILSVGAGLTEDEAGRPQIFDIKDHRVAVLGYVDTHLHSADLDTAGNNPGSRRKLAADIDMLRDQVDWVIVTYHWHDIAGVEPTEQQMRLARLAVDEGADLVVGYHPGVIQGGEVYNGRAIAYSLGSAPSDTTSTPQETQLSGDTPQNGLDSVPHQLPDSGTLSVPSQSQSEDFDNANQNAGVQPSMASMLKVVLGDRHMSVQFIPIQTEATGSAYAEGQGRRTVLQQIRAASRSFDAPLLDSDGMKHLSLDQTIRAFPNSGAEDFQPTRTDGFIEQTDSE